MFFKKKQQDDLIFDRWADEAKVIGVYRIEDNPDVHLVEVEIWEKPSLVRINSITQQIINIPREHWEKPHEVQYLNEDGSEITCEKGLLPKSNMAPTRLVFFMFYLNLDKPLLTQFGKICLPNPSSMPFRLKSLIKNDEICLEKG